MSYHLEFEHWIPFPPERVFRFFADPHNLPRIMPPASATRILRLDLVPPRHPESAESTVGEPNLFAGIGSTIVTSFRPFPALPFRALWVARITEFEWDHHFADVQEKGPFHSWHHRHEFVAEMRGSAPGTLVRDLIDYEIGFGLLGRLAQGLFVARQMQSIFTHRQKVLQSLLA